MAETNPNSRLETFCDGVFAIALTLLIIDVKIPSTASINSTADFWTALGHLAPSLFSFLLSFVVILITWVNHHATLKLVDKTSVAFMYANGFFLLPVVFIPFPTSLLGEYLFTDHAAPAVILFNLTLTVQALSWVFLAKAAFRGQLLRNESAASTMSNGTKFGYIAMVVYSLCAIIAVWFPLIVALITTLIWVFWLIWGISVKQGQVN